MAMSATHRSKFAALTGNGDFSILEWEENTKHTKIQLIEKYGAKWTEKFRTGFFNFNFHWMLYFYFNIELPTQF